MIFPRYSLRWLLAIVFGCALFFFCFSLALRGHDWAVGIVAPGLGIILLFALFLIAYSIAFIVGSLIEGLFGRRGEPTTPFSMRPAPLAAVGPPPTGELVVPEIVAPEIDEEVSSDNHADTPPSPPLAEGEST